MDVGSINGFYEELIEEIGERRILFDYPIGKKSNVSEKIPLVREIYQENISKLNHCQTNETIKVDGYLERNNNKIDINLLKKWEKAHDISFHAGCKIYNYYAESSFLDMQVFIVCNSSLTPSTEMPNELVLTRLSGLGLKSLDYKQYFLLKEFNPTVIKPPKTLPPFPLMPLKRIIKSFAEISTLSNNDEHIVNSLISPYVGTNFTLKTDGIGCSYVQDKGISDDLNIIHKALNNTEIGLPLSNFGIINFLKEDLVNIERQRARNNKLRTISWNMASDSIDNIIHSEFKYNNDNEIIGIENVRDLDFNIQLQNSLLYYNIKDKKINEKEFRAIHSDVLEKIYELYGSDRSNVLQYMDEKNLDIHIGRMQSFFTAFFQDDIDKIKKEIIDSTTRNFDSVLAYEDTKHSYSENPEIASHRSEFEKKTYPRVRLAFINANGDKNTFIEELGRLLGWSEKKALEEFTRLYNGGYIYPINTEETKFRWYNESEWTFKK
ncbi:MAG: hypothetical protein JW716_02525 [Candidatus Aenigmarchaeota archaeon]|nr:hypothetical protein [Candidatus Aenigmarchaeota archaeon]